MILKAQQPIPSGMMSQYFSMSLLMVFAGWAAENNIIGKLPGFVLGMACWLWIVYDTTAGEGAKQAATLKSAASKQAFNTLKMIVSIGWTIYPLGFMIAYIIPGPIIRPHREGPPYDALNIVYNLADLVNKGGFGMCVWSAAMADRDTMMG
jgi:bacteriorhodopsin